MYRVTLKDPEDCTEATDETIRDPDVGTEGSYKTPKDPNVIYPQSSCF